jgi:hypothetical protein
MTRFSEPREAGFQWIRSSRFERHYELRDAGGTAHAQLTFEQLIGRDAVARANGSVWTLSTEGWLRPRISVQSARGTAPAANLEMLWLGWAGRGLLTLADGRRFSWASTSLLHDRRWAFTDTASGRAAVVFEKTTLEQARAADVLCARVTIEQAFGHDHAMDLLAVLSVYLQG